MDDPASRLALQWKKGDRDAFVALVDLLHDRLFRLACRITNDHDAAQDVLQEALIRIGRGISRWDGRSAFYTWAYRVTANLAIDLVRDRERERKAREAWDGARERDPFDSPEDPFADEETREQKRRLLDAVRALPPGQRAIVAMRHYDGLSLKQIAEARACAVGTVKSTLFQAFRSLQRSLGADGAAAGGGGGGGGGGGASERAGAGDGARALR